MRPWLNATIFETQFDAWCRGCNEDVREGFTMGFIPGEKGAHCLACIIESNIDALFDKDDND